MKPITQRKLTDTQRRAMFAKGAKGVRGKRRVVGVPRNRLRGARSRRGSGLTPGPSPRGFAGFVKKHEGLIGRAVQSRVRRHGLPRGGDLEKELRQEAMIAMWKAKKAFNPKKGKWSTFATRHIEGAIGRALKKQGPVTLGERETRRRLGRGQKVMDLAPLGDVDLERKSMGGINRIEARQTLRGLLKGYPLRDRQIAIGHLGEGRSQTELAKRFKLSKARVNQIIKKIQREVREKEAA